MKANFTEIAQKHYENFPVGSLLLLKKYRDPIHQIYVFARVADDFADEGTCSVSERLEKLEQWKTLLHSAVEGKQSDEFFSALATTIATHNLPLHLFDNLIVAFKRDAKNTKYQTFSEVLDYCSFSANPIGRLLLKIFQCSNEETERFSDNICTALQLTNFWQDMSVDIQRNRLYIAQDELKQYRFTIADLYNATHRNRIIAFLQHKVEWTRELFESGVPLFFLVPKKFQFELRLIWFGGMRILDKIERVHFDTLRIRPILDTKDKLIIFLKAFASLLHGTFSNVRHLGKKQEK